MPESIIVGIGQIATASAPARLVAYGLGSCLGIVLYDAVQQRGALAHPLLPRHTPGTLQERTAKFTDVAITLMMEELLKSGCDSLALVAKLAGGATMFGDLYSEGQVGIGERNILAAREMLSRYSIPVASEDVGGDYGRSIAFDLTSGRLSVRSLTTNEISI